MLPIEQCYGVIVVFKGEENQFLLLRIKSTLDEFWTFPKGHHEGTESPKETALRELKEESGITEIELLDFPLIGEANEVNRHGEIRLKINEYFIGFVKNKDVIIDMDEISEYKWLSFDDAFSMFKFLGSRQNVLKQANEYLKTL
jgi:bis(5'-nucleosidyl)-tetraphosphatase